MGSMARPYIRYKLWYLTMCGICGVLAFRDENFQVTAEYLSRMRETMSHRGPDGAGLWISPDRRVGLGHRRLSIIDLSNSASQPMSNADGSLQIVFNGEIYNHAEIRRELEAEGEHRWKTDHSDTEVILHAFEKWGIACLRTTGWRDWAMGGSKLDVRRLLLPALRGGWSTWEGCGVCCMLPLIRRRH